MDVPQNVIAAIRNMKADEIGSWSKQGYRVVNYRVCRVCGRVEWSSCEEKVAHEEVEVRARFNESYGPGCDLCSTVAMRSPEIYAWVRGVSLMTEMLMDATRTEVKP